MSTIALIIVGVIFFIIQRNDMQELQKENQRLKEIIRRYKNENGELNHLKQESMTTSLDEKNSNEEGLLNVSQNNQASTPIYTKYHEHEEPIVKPRILTPEEKMEQKRNKEKAKNTLILATGALLIVLAAIVFLLTTWNTTPNAIKTGVLIVLIGLFLGMSYVSDKKFHLEQTSKTFYYIAMAYIPIVLVAISAFQLLGEFLSFKGKGCYIYLAVSSLLLAFLYGFESMKKERKVLAIAGLVAQMGAICFVFCHLKIKEMVILYSLIIIYNILLGIVSKIRPSKYYDQIFSEFQKVVFLGTFCITILSILPKYVGSFNKCKLFDLLPLFLLIFNYFLLQFKEKYKILLLDTLLIFFVITLTHLHGIRISNEMRQFVGLTFSLALFTGQYLVTKVTDHKHLAYIAFASIGIIMTIEVLDAISWEDCNFIHILYLVALIVNYFMLHIEKKYASFIFDAFLLLCIDAVINLKAFSVTDQIEFFIISATITAIYVVRYLLTKDDIYKMITYASSNLLLGSVFWLCDLDKNVFKYIPFITTMIVLAIERMNPNEMIKYYLLGSFGISFLICGFDSATISFLLTLVLSGIFIVFVKKMKLNQFLNLTPLFFLMNGLFFAHNLIIWKIKLYVILALLIIAFLTVLSIFEKKDNMYTFASVVYILLGIAQLELNKYIWLAVVILWALLHIFNRKQIKPYLSVLYTACLVFYNFIVFDLKFDDITLIKLFGYIPFIYLMSREVLGKNKTLEYIGTATVYYIALMLYPDVINAMIFIAFLVAMVVLGYQKKIGPLFLTSLVAIVINTFKLTYKFWESVPWWVYLVTVGGILLAFAVHNEMNENKNKEKLNDALNKLKERVDL